MSSLGNPRMIPITSTTGTSTSESSDVILQLKTKVNECPKLGEAIVRSLNAAKKVSQDILQKDLYDALTWPTTMEEYYAYLMKMSRWIPNQSGQPAWKIPGNSNGGYQEVYDRLCHFYFLIDGPDGTEIAENLPWFREWLVSYAQAWGSFLDSPESFNDKILASFNSKNAPKYRVEDSMIEFKVDGKVRLRPNAPSGWMTYNQFFARNLNPGLRPIASPHDNTIIASPADCTFRESFLIDECSCIKDITVKLTHRFASIEVLLGTEDGSGTNDSGNQTNKATSNSNYGTAFAGGVFSHYFLGPYSYHRLHCPVAGTVIECKNIEGLAYLDVGIDSNGQFDAPDSAKDGYEFAQARGVLIIDTKGSPCGDVGLVAVVPVGMVQVSSVYMTAVKGQQIAKGEEFGFFQFGASDIIVLYQQQAKAVIDQDGSVYRHYGTKIGQLQLCAGSQVQSNGCGADGDDAGSKRQRTNP